MQPSNYNNFKSLFPVEAPVSTPPQATFNAGGGVILVSAGGNTCLGSAFTFSNFNNISFGISNGTLTASVSYPIQTVQTQNLVTVQGSIGAIVFSNANGVTFGGNNSTITASISVPTGEFRVSAGGSSADLTNLIFSNANNVSFGLNNGTLTATASISTTNYIFSESNNITFGTLGSTVTALATFAQSNQTQSVIQGVSAGTQIGNSGNIIFSNANGVSFGLAGSNTMTASFSQSNDTDKAGTGFTSAGANIGLSGTLNSNGLRLSATVTPGGGGGAFSASGGSSTFDTLVFTNSNGFTFSNIGGSLRASYTVPTVTNSSFTVSADTRSETISKLVFSNSNGISFGLTGGTITGTVKTDYQSSGAYLTTAMASNRGSDFVQATAAFAGTNASGTIASDGISVSVAAQSSVNQNASLFAIGNTTQNSSTVLSVNALSFNAIGSLTVGYSNGSIQLSAPNALTSQSNQAFSAGAASSTFQTLSFQDSSGISFSNNAGAIRLTHDLQFTSATSAITSNALNTSASRVINIVAATNSTGGGTASLSSNVSFSAANGVTFYTSAGGAIVGSVQTNYQSTGNYLTTAALSSQTLVFSLSGNTATTNSSQISNGGYALAGGNGVTLQQSNNTVSISVATNYQSQGAYLTTADLSANSSNYVRNWKLTGNTAGTTSSAQGTDLWLAGGNGVTLSGSSNTISFSVATNYQSQGAYLTTAALSQDSSKYAGTGVTTAGGAGFSATLNTAGLSVSIPSWLTTADLSANSSKYIQNWKLTGNTAGTTSSAQGTDLWFSGGNSITVSGNSNSIVFSVGNYLTTARASNDAIGLNTAKTNVTWTVNSSGLSLDAGGYAGTGTSATNASITLNSAGLAISVAAPGAAAENNWVNLLGANTAGNTTASGSTIGWSGINLTLSGTNASQVVISAAAQTNQTVGMYATGNTTQNSSTTFDARTLGTFNAIGAMTVGYSNGSVQLSAPATSSISGTGQVSVSVNASTIFIGVPSPFMSSYQNMPALVNSSLMTWNGTSLSHADAFEVPMQLSFNFLRMPVLFTTNSTTISTIGSATASAQGGIFSTVNAVIYSLGTGASSKSLQMVTSGSTGYSFTQKISMSNTTQGSYSLGYTGWAETALTSLSTRYSVSNTNYSFTTSAFTAFTSARMLDIPVSGSLSAGPYWIIVGMSTSSSTAGNTAFTAITNCNVRYSAHYGVSQLDVPFGIMGSTNLTSGGLMGAGSFSTAGGATSGSIDISAISSIASHAVPFFQLLRSA